MRHVTMNVAFEGFGGSLRGKQDLRYAEHDNKAFDAPAGRQYARNYKPSIVITNYAKTGKVSFQIKTKSATKITAQSLTRMAILGGSGAIIGAILANKVAPLYVALDQAYQNAVHGGELRTFRAWLNDKIQYMLKNKQNSCIFGQPVLASTRINNPWVAGGTGTNVTISDKVLLKFAEYLCRTAIYVNGEFACGFPGTTNNKMSEFLSSKFNKLSDGSTAFKDGAKLLSEASEVIDRLGYSSYEQDGNNYAYCTYAEGGTTELETSKVVPAGKWSIVASNVEPND